MRIVYSQRYIFHILSKDDDILKSALNLLVMIYGRSDLFSKTIHTELQRQMKKIFV